MMLLMTKIRFTPNSLWFFRGIRGRKDEATGESSWAFPPGFYRFKALAMDYKTRQQKVVYHGDAPGQHDDGKYFIATLNDWAMSFEPAQEADPPAEEPATIPEPPTS